MSYQDKLSRVLALIEEHNKNVGANAIVAADFEKKLKALGATTESSLAQCTWEDLIECGLPKILARQAATILRQSELGAAVSEAASAGLDAVNRATGSLRKKLKEMNYTELFERYRPHGTTGDDAAVEAKLKELSKGKRCVVMLDGAVHAERSAKLLEELNRGYPEVEVVVVNDKPVRVLKVGEVADDIVDENPLYPGRALRPDGTCDQTNRSWAGVDFKVRQLLRVAMSTGEVPPMSVQLAHDLLDRALSSPSASVLAQRYPKATVKLDELAGVGKQPTLKVSLNATSRAQNPFVAAASA